jgi:hypothetical protein
MIVRQMEEIIGKLGVGNFRCVFNELQGKCARRGLTGWDGRIRLTPRGGGDFAR